MPRNAGFSRARWTRPLAKSIGWRPQRMRLLFKRNGLTPPYTDIEKALAILDKNGISTTKFRAQNATPPPLNDEGKVSAGKQLAVRGRAPAEPKPLTGVQKYKEKVKKRLIYRLAMLLPEGPCQYGKSRVRAILAKHGVRKPYEDERRALDAFRAEGINVDRFQYLNGGDAPVMLPELSEAQVKLVLDHYLRKHPEYGMIEAARNTKTMLEQMETHFFQEARKGNITKMIYPLDEAFCALNEMRRSRR